MLLAVSLRAMSNLISCKNMKILVVVVQRFTQQTEKEEEEGEMDGWSGMREGRFVLACWMGARGRLGRNCRISAVGGRRKGLDAF